MSWNLFGLYLTFGYALAIAIPALVLAILTKHRSRRILYAGAFLLAGSCTGHQMMLLLHTEAASNARDQVILRWQADFIVLIGISVCVVVRQQLIRHPWKNRWIWWIFLPSIFSLAINHLSAQPALAVFSAYGPAQKAIAPDALLSWLWWLGVLSTILSAAYCAVERVWRDYSRYRLVYAAILLCCVLACGLMALGHGGFYDSAHGLGLAMTILLVWVAVGLAEDSAARGQKLVLRERQMEREIRQRRAAERNLERLSQVFMQSPTPTHIVDLSGRVIQINDASSRFFHRDVSEIPVVNFLSLLELLDVDIEQLLHRLAMGQVQECGPYFFNPGIPVGWLYRAQPTWLSFKLYPIFDQRQRLNEIVVRINDITEQHYTENVINVISKSVSAETGQVFFDHLALNLAGLLQKNYVFIGLLSSVDGVQVLQTRSAVINGEIVENLVIPIAQTPSEKVLKMGKLAVEDGLQELYPNNDLIRQFSVKSYLGLAIKGKSNESIGVIVVADNKPMLRIQQVEQIVTIFVSRVGTELQRLQAEDEIRRVAFEDYLTGLPNRTRLSEHVSFLLSGNISGIQHAFIQVDLDHFKTINDALGHDVGDEVLCIVASRLSEDLGGEVFIARIGGDEFALVLSDIERANSFELSTFLPHLIHLLQRPVEMGDHFLELGCSVGVVVFPEFASTVVDVFRNADIALNRAKTEGRGGFALFTPVMRESLNKRIALEKGLREAINNDELCLFYQPQLNDKGELVGVEALARWLHPTQGWIPPFVFIPVAEETGLINPIGGWVLETALKHRKSWFQRAGSFVGHVSINVSAWQFSRSDFIDGVYGLVERLQVSPADIVLELTESALLTDVDDTIKKLTDLRDHGYSIALDDFGTGYSSLAYLRDLPLDILKIDKSFVDTLAVNEHEPLVESMISIGRHMGLQVIAEGVETEIQKERLIALGCQVFQGYLFAKPMPEVDFVDWAKHHQG